MIKKYIIYRRNGALKHFIFPFSMLHYEFIKDNGIKDNELIEQGIIDNGAIKVLYCKDKKHLRTRDNITQLSEHSINGLYLQTRIKYQLQYAGD